MLMHSRILDLCSYIPQRAGNKFEHNFAKRSFTVSSAATRTDGGVLSLSGLAELINWSGKKNPADPGYYLHKVFRECIRVVVSGEACHRVQCSGTWLAS